MQPDSAEKNSIGPLLIGSCPSSGSTLLSIILSAHPSLLCGPELSLFSHPFFWKLKDEEWRKRILESLNSPELMLNNWDLDNGCVPYSHLIDIKELDWYENDIHSFTQLVKKSNSAKSLIDSIYKPLLQKRKKQAWVEKSPPNLYSMISFLEIYPEGRGIVIVRDGRDVICSLMRRGLSLNSAVSIWLIETTIALQLSELKQVYLIRYEDLVFNTEKTLKDMFNYIDVDAHYEKLIHYYKYTDRNKNNPREIIGSWKNNPFDGIKTDSVNRWKHDLLPENLDIFYSYCINSKQDILLENNILPTYSTIKLLNILGYSTPENIDISWNSYHKYIKKEKHPFAHITKAGGLHRRNTHFIFFPDTKIKIKDFVLIIHSITFKFMASIYNAKPYKNKKRIILSMLIYTKNFIKASLFNKAI